MIAAAIHPLGRFNADRFIVDLDLELADIEAEHRFSEVVHHSDVNQNTSNVNTLAKRLRGGYTLLTEQRTRETDRRDDADHPTRQGGHEIRSWPLYASPVLDVAMRGLTYCRKLDPIKTVQ